MDRISASRADGYLFCRCPVCSKLGPVEQFQRLFRIAVEEAVKSGKDISMQHLTYVWRYALPKDMSVFEHVDAVMFDTHQRYRGRVLGEDHKPNVGSEQEAQIDSRVKEVSFNRYLLDRLGEWRNAFKGTLYVFENLMVQGSVSCPQSYTPQLIRDMDIFEDLGIDGTVYEAFEPGMESFAEQIGVLARAMWSGDIAYEPTALERLCQTPGNAKPALWDILQQTASIRLQPCGSIWTMMS